MSGQYFFGSGNLITTRTDVANSTPVRFGVLQDVEVDFDFTNKELIGQYQFPVDVARSSGKIMIKAKTALLLARGVNDSFFGQTLTTAGGPTFVNNESGTIPTPSGPYTITVTHSGTFVSDEGVYFAASGLPLVKVASGPTTGQYSVSAGVYTFAAADDGLGVFISYQYTLASGASEISIANLLQGSSPVFSIMLSNTYKGNTITWNLNQAISTKLTFPFKNTDYEINDFEASAYADQAGNIGTLTLTQ